MAEKILNIVKLVLVNFAIFLVGIATLEIGGQAFYRAMKGQFIYQSLPKNEVFKEHPYLVGVPRENVKSISPDGKVTITTDENGFRITGPEQSSPVGSTQKVVVCIGGSTTFGTSVTDSDTWPYILQSKLGDGYRVFNLGVPGTGTAEAIILTSLRAPELHPDVIVYYQGWNDIRNYHVRPATPDYYWHGMSQRTSLGLERKSFGGELADRLAIIHFTKWIRQRLLSNVVQPAAPTFETIDARDPYVDSIYVRNLRTLKALSTRLGAQSIFVPQVINSAEFEKSSAPSRWWTPHIPDRSVPEMMRAFNQLVEKNIEEDKNTAVVRGIMDEPWVPTHFIDDGHFSRDGAEVFTDLLVPKIKNLEPRTTVVADR